MNAFTQKPPASAVGQTRDPFASGTVLFFKRRTSITYGFSLLSDTLVHWELGIDGIA